MGKRLRRDLTHSILEVLSDAKPHSYGDIERRANTNWRTVRDITDDLALFEAASIEDSKVTITTFGKHILKKLDKQYKA